VDRAYRVAVPLALVLATTLTGCGSPRQPVTVKLQLNKTEFPANGQSITAVVEVTNDSRSPVYIVGKCAPLFLVGLTNRTIPFNGSTLLPDCGPAVLKAGVTQYTLHLSADYPGCAEQGGSPPDNADPYCLGTQDKPSIPPLPPGRYKAEVFLQEESLQTGNDISVAAKPVTVTLTK
jgi:hypothetical protein